MTQFSDLQTGHFFVLIGEDGAVPLRIEPGGLVYECRLGLMLGQPTLMNRLYEKDITPDTPVQIFDMKTFVAQ